MRILIVGVLLLAPLALAQTPGDSDYNDTAPAPDDTSYANETYDAPSTTNETLNDTDLNDSLAEPDTSYVDANDIVFAPTTSSTSEPTPAPATGTPTGEPATATEGAPGFEGALAIAAVCLLAIALRRR